MKREFLEGLDLGNGAKLPKEAIDAIMAENGKDIEAQKNTITTLTTARDGLQTQLDEANKTIKSYKDMKIEDIQQAVKDWEAKYNTDTQKLKDDLAAVQYGHAVEAAVADLKFSSASARKQFVSDLTAKKLSVDEGGKLLGLEDFTKTYQETDPDAFVSEEDDKTPVFTRGGTGGASGKSGGQMTMKEAIAAAMKKQ